MKSQIGILLLLCLLATPSWCEGGDQYEQQKVLREYFDRNDKFANMVDKPLELMKDPKYSLLSKQYVNALLMVQIANELAMANDFDGFKIAIEEIDKKLLEKFFPQLANVLGWYSWAKTGMELFKAFVWDPALERISVEEYIAAREMSLEPADAFAKLHQFGQMRLAAIDRLVKAGELSSLAFVEGSKDQLLPRWEAKLMEYANAWFERQYQAKLLKNALAALAAEKGKAQAELAQLDAALLKALKEKEKEKIGEKPTDEKLQGEPSPPTDPQEWAGHWRGHSKATVVADNIPPPNR